MRTKKRYYEQPDLNHANAKIIAVKLFQNKQAICLDCTIFYPEGGGQPCDLGTVNDIALQEVQIIDNEIWHFLEKKSNLKCGDAVILKLNRERRDDHAVQHSAQHLLSAILYDKYNAQTISFHLGKEVSTLDIEKQKLKKTDFDSVEMELLEAIVQNKKFIQHIYKNKEEIKNKKIRKKPAVTTNIRIVEIEGYDASPCGGTHVRTTGQLGFVKIVKVESYKNNWRITFVAGKRGLLLMQKKQNILSSLTTLKTCSEHDLVMVLMKEKNENMKQLQQLKQVKKSLIKQILMKHLHAESTCFTYSFEEEFFDENDLQMFSKLLPNNIENYILGSMSACKIIINLSLKNINVGHFIKIIREKYRCKGGGNTTYGQVLFDSKEDYKRFFDEEGIPFFGK